jgi:hypothetical protein
VTAFVLLAQDQDRLGTIPDWIAALGTVAAFFVALRLLAKELAARREVEQDRRRAQARLVSAWQEPRFDTAPSGKSTATFVVILKNSSEEPVYEVWLTLVPDTSTFASDPEAVWGDDGAAKEADTESSRGGMVPPGETVDVLVMPGRYPTKRLVLGLSFTDSQGRRWKRLPNGTLVEVTKGQPRRGRTT